MPLDTVSAQENLTEEKARASVLAELPAVAASGKDGVYVSLPDDMDKRKLFRLEEQFELTSPTGYTYTLTLPEEIYQDQRAYQEKLSNEGKIYEVTP